MEVVRPAVLAIRYDELPSMDNGHSQRSMFSLYRGVIVCWDEDYDTRILDFIDDLDEFNSRGLIAVQEHEGSIAFRWNGRIPSRLRQGNCITVRDGDVWSIYESISIGNQST